MTADSICEKCMCSYRYHAHYGEFRSDPKDVEHGACPERRSGGFRNNSTFQSFPRCGIPDCVPNGGIEIGDGYYKY